MAILIRNQLDIQTPAGLAPFVLSGAGAAQLNVNLNADLLDGEHGDFYRNAGNLNAGTVPAARLSGVYTSLLAMGLQGVTDANLAPGDLLPGDSGGIYGFFGSNGTNYPNNAPGGGLRVDFAGPGDGLTGSWQLWSQAQTTASDLSLWFRKYTRITGASDRQWSNWCKVWHDRNDGSGSGLDADLLDNLDGAHYLAWANFTGKPTTLAGYGITDALNTSGVAQVKTGGLTVSNLTTRSAGSGVSVDAGPVETPTSTNAGTLNLHTGPATSGGSTSIYWHLVSRASNHPTEASRNNLELFLRDTTSTFQRAMVCSGATREFHFGPSGSPTAGYTVTLSNGLLSSAGHLRAPYLITTDAALGVEPATTNTGRIGSSLARWQTVWGRQLNAGTHAQLTSSGSGTTTFTAPILVAGDPSGALPTDNTAWAWVQGLTTGMGYPETPALLGAWSNNLLAHWTDRGGTVNASATGGATWTDTLNCYAPRFLYASRTRGRAVLTNGTGVAQTFTLEFLDPVTTANASNSRIYTFTNRTTWAPYVVFRETANITGIKVEVKIGADDTVAYTTVFDGVPTFVKFGLWRGPVFYSTSSAFAVLAVKFTFTHAGGATAAEILEVGLADNWGIHGRYLWATPWATQTWTAQQTFNTAPLVGANPLFHAGNDGVGSGLDADLLRGRGFTASGNRWGIVPLVGDDGVMEVGRYIDFHNSDGSTADSDVRLDTGGTDTDLFIDGKKIAKTHSTSIGDGYATSYVITHGLGTKDVTVQLRRNSDDALGNYATSIVATSTSQVTVAFAAAPSSNQYRVTIIG